MTLAAPPRNLSTLSLATKSIAVCTLFRISGHNSGEPYFGTAASFRFDDPGLPKKSRFGTCYCGFDLETALAETVLHDEMPHRGKFRISSALFASKFLVSFQGGPLNVADLTGVPLKLIGGNGAISTILPYDIPQKWSRAVHQHPQNVDGILFVSRHLNDRLALVIFSRAAGKFKNAAYTPLNSAPGISGATTALQITFPYP